MYQTKKCYDHPINHWIIKQNWLIIDWRNFNAGRKTLSFRWCRRSRRRPGKWRKIKRVFAWVQCTIPCHILCFKILCSDCAGDSLSSPGISIAPGTAPRFWHLLSRRWRDVYCGAGHGMSQSLASQRTPIARPKLIACWPWKREWKKQFMKMNSDHLNH